tara:strand:- start:81 stop:611 length:531 start_codon:yes stop_codon:yes gene_type:complete
MHQYAIVIIDTWNADMIANKSLIDVYEQMIQRIQKMILQLPSNCVAIIADYESDGRILHPNIESLMSSNEHISKKCLRSTNRDEVLTYLDERKIEKLYYMGASMPGCVTDRPVGLKNMPEYFTKSIVIDATMKMTSLETNLIDVIHDSYHSSIGMAKRYGWNINWTRDFETPNYYY